MTQLQPDSDAMPWGIRGSSSTSATVATRPCDRIARPCLSGGRAMNRIPMSLAASALLRALIARAGVTRDRILLRDAHSIDWRSLTFSGERHLIELRVPGPDSRCVVDRMCAGLEEAEFSIPGVIVAVSLLLARRAVRSTDRPVSRSRRLPFPQTSGGNGATRPGHPTAPGTRREC